MQPTQPATTQTAPATTADPAPVVPDETTAAAATPTSQTTTTTTKAVRRTSHVAAAKPAPVVKHTTTHSVTTHAAAVAAPAPAPATPAAAAPAPVAPPPAANVSAQPAAPVQAPAANSDQTLPIAAGGALALLALGGAAVAVTRRRRRREEEQDWADQEAIADEQAETGAMPEATPEPVHEESPAIAAPSAFAWGNSPEGTQAERSNESLAEQEDRRPGETWVERAYRGPTPNNPSVSLRHRLRRAAFFDKRERDAAAGLAEPIEADAGLPDAMVEQQDRELA